MVQRRRSNRSLEASLPFAHTLTGLEPVRGFANV